MRAILIFKELGPIPVLSLAGHFGTDAHGRVYCVGQSFADHFSPFDLKRPEPGQFETEFAKLESQYPPEEFPPLF